MGVCPLPSYPAGSSRLCPRAWAVRSGPDDRPPPATRKTPTILRDEIALHRPGHRARPHQERHYRHAGGRRRPTPDGPDRGPAIPALRGAQGPARQDHQGLPHGVFSPYRGFTWGSSCFPPSCCCGEALYGSPCSPCSCGPTSS